MPDLYHHSLKVIQTYQSPGGAYVASPNFATYRYAWFRDGAFTAYAMDVAGRHESARRFHDWASRTVLRHAEQAERAIEKAMRGQPLGEDYLHTRYAVDGQAGTQDWPNFQIDGLGTWLWALAWHLRCTAEPLPSTWKHAVRLVARYLAALWALPCYDLWEEHSSYLHSYTLAAIYGGLQAAGELFPEGDWSFSAVADEIKRFVLRHGVRDGRLSKSIAPPSGTAARSPLLSLVDASLVGVATPYRLFSPGDAVVRATVARIEAELHPPGGGVHRYRSDTYYGGGEWVLLAAWLGWYYTEVGERERARALLHWVEAQADPRKELPEQVSTHLLAPAYRAGWQARWGPVARPLLWSHAMYIILCRALGA